MCTCTHAAVAPQAAANVADINLDIHVDTVTANKIRELARAKDTAVANEDYDEAKRLKASIDRLKVGD
jgi:centrosomal protein CEP104